MIELRPYQRSALDGIWSFWDRAEGSPLVVAPTGSGKSVLIASFVKETRERYPGTRFLIVTHVKELIEQNFRAMLRLWPVAPAGIYSAGLGQRSLNNPITFCGIQSVHAKPHAFGHVDLFLIDEAHLLSRRGDSMYQKFIEGLRTTNPQMKVVGFTATPYRLDSGRLDKGDGKLFDGIAYDIGIGALVDQGYLAPLVSKATETALDVSAVHKRGGEFIEGELQKAIDKWTVTSAAVREIVAFGQTRQSWLCFCAGVEHARHVAEALRESGMPASHVTGDMPGRERDQILAAFKSGELRAVANANILTTGFDHPPLDLIAMLRPTLSTGLYVQMLGRGMRTSEGKANCLVLDFARNVERHGPVDAVRIKEPGEGGGIAPVKECPDCRSILHTAVRVCPDCGYTFPFQTFDDKIEATASRAAVMARDVLPNWVRCANWTFERHVGASGVPTVRVTYQCGLQFLREWICPVHEGWARVKFGQWWKMHNGRDPLPSSPEEVISRSDELTLPSELMVRKDGKKFTVASRRFVRQEVAA